MASKKRVPKIRHLSNVSILSPILKRIEKGSSLQEIKAYLKKRKIVYTETALRDLFQTLVRGSTLVKHLSRYRPSDRLPNYLFVPLYGRPIQPYRVRVAYTFQNKLTGNVFERYVTYGFNERPKLRTLYATMQGEKEWLKENGSIEVVESSIALLSKSVDE